MPRSQKSASNTSAQLSARVDEELKRQYKEVLDRQNRTMTDAVEEHMERVVAEHGGDVGDADYLPADDELATAYVRLETLADPDARRVDVEVAEAELASALGRPKKTVRPAVLRPLERRGYVEPKYGKLRVATPDEVVR